MMRFGIAKALLLSAVLAATALTPAAAGAQDGEIPEAAETTEKIEELTSMIERNPGDVELLIDLGNTYYESNMMDQALATYEEAAKLDSTHVGVKLNLGSLLADMGRFERSIHELKTALSIDPDNVLVAATLGSAYYGQGRYREAVDMYRSALEIDPRNTEAHFNLGVAFADVQMFDEAIREWEKVIEYDPDSRAAAVSRENIDMIREFRGH
ncbi:MAG: tetratricopeptide repeat protein [Candidatus Eisenbacteria bacterium]|nr:tetratricopeptide repeat protein [Candidatus Eisenbacteria bacterium]